MPAFDGRTDGQTDRRRLYDGKEPKTVLYRASRW